MNRWDPFGSSSGETPFGSSSGETRALGLFYAAIYRALLDEDIPHEAACDIIERIARAMLGRPPHSDPGRPT